MEDQRDPQPLLCEDLTDSAPASPLKAALLTFTSVPELSTLHVQLDQLLESRRVRNATLQRLVGVYQDLQSQVEVQGDKKAKVLNSDQKEWKERL